jgi:exoribonuclease R
MLRLFVKDHGYSSWDYQVLLDPPSQEIQEPNPIEYRLLNNDTIAFDSNTNRYILQHSPTRDAKYLPGVLILEGNQTFGRTKNRKRLLYKCIPDDKHLPHFLVPYDIILDFSKSHKNKYVLFKYQEWVDEHPIGQLVETLGNIDHLETFYEYQLYSKSLHSTLKEMTTKMKEMTKKKSMLEYFQEIQHNPDYKIQDDRHKYVFTIDSQNTTEFDDALNIEYDPIQPNIAIVTVYVSQVVFWLELFQLWDSFDNRISTIYLPDRRRPMLPTILTDSLCSLKEGQERFAIAFQFQIDQSTPQSIRSMGFYNAVIKTTKNYVYEESKLVFQDREYIRLFELTTRLNHSIKNSCELVSYWMIQVNRTAANFMIKHKTGIYRIGSATKSPTEPTDTTIEEQDNYKKLDQETRRYIEYHANAQSVLYQEGLKLDHELMDQEHYLRITSAIRRYEDICNQRELMRLMGITLRKGVPLQEFFQENLCNERYRSIKKVEAESEMMRRVMLNQEYYVTGILYSRRPLPDGRFHYKVYIKGQGIKDVKMRLMLELYKEYRVYRYVKDRGGGLKIKMEISMTD